MTTLGARPRSLPLVPIAAPGKRMLPLADAVRPRDGVKPFFVVWEITLACDLACRHCGSRAGKARPDELTTAEALDLIRQMAELDVREVALIGGEAYLRPDFFELIRAIKDRGMSCLMTTGGRGVTAELAREARAAGLRNVSVSIDGLRESHDTLRAVQGSFDSALAAVDHFRAAGCPVSVNTQVNRLSMRELPAILDIMIAKGTHAWQVQLTTAMGRAGDEPEMLLEPYQMLEVMPLIGKLHARAKEHKIRLWAGNNVGYYGPLEHQLRGEYPKGHRGACSAGKMTMGIEANGTIKGCPSLPTEEFSGGSIRDHSLKEIWQKAPMLRFARDMTVENLSGFCRDCYYAEDCLGGCNWTSVVLFGKTGDNPYCHHRSLELLAKGERERIQKTKPAPGEPFDHGEFAIVREPWPADELARAQAVARGDAEWLAD